MLQKRMQNQSDDSDERPTRKSKKKAKKGGKNNKTKRPASIEVDEESKDSSDDYDDRDSDSDEGFQRQKKKQSLDIRGETVPTKKGKNDESHMTYKSAMDRSSIKSTLSRKKQMTIEEFVAREFGS